MVGVLQHGQTKIWDITKCVQFKVELNLMINFFFVCVSVFININMSWQVPQER